MKYFRVLLFSFIAFGVFCIQSLGYSPIKYSPKSCYFIEPLFASFDKDSYPKDAWIGLYKTEDKYYDYVDMFYLKDLKDNLFSTYSPNEDGKYEFRIYDSKYKLLSKSGIIKVAKRASSVTDEVYNEPKLSIYTKSSDGKLKIFADYTNIDVNTHNYIGLYQKDELNNKYIEFIKAPQKKSGQLSFSIPRSDEEYEFRVFNNDYYNLVYRSDVFKLEDLVKTNFTDLSQEDSSYNAVKYLNERGLMSGAKNNTIRPNERITRAEFAKFLYNCMSLKASADKQYFTDVSPKYWAYQYIQADRYFMNYYSDKNRKYFKPESYITREEAANAVVKGFGLSGNVKSNTIEQFSDYRAISPQYVKSVAIAVKAGVLGKVDTKFEPRKPMTRGEVSLIFYKLLSR